MDTICTVFVVLVGLCIRKQYLVLEYRLRMSNTLCIRKQYLVLEYRL